MSSPKRGGTVAESSITEDPWALKVLAAVAELGPQRYYDPVITSEVVKNDLVSLIRASQKLQEKVSIETSEARHDRRNIIGAIRGYSEMLLEDSEALPSAVRAHLLQILAAAKTEPTSTPQSPTKTPSVTLLPSDEPGVILAVDDLPENRELVSRLLQKTGHTVISAESGEEALELLDTMGVDVVLLDLVMPGIGGAEVLKRLKEDERLRATPVVMISGQQDMDQIVGCIEAGADDYLLKPFNPVLLQARISAGIERKRWHDREELYREQLERREQFIRATFGRYLSDDIVDEILERPEGLELGGDLREVTIMMSDIRGFTTLVEHLPPQQVVTLLNRYLGRMTEIILEFGGTIDEFLGDAVLAVFGAPRRNDDDPDRAVRCALAMQDAMADINAANIADDLPEVEMAIALNTGSVVAGNIGSERRSKYGFVGHAMNVTSRIEDVADSREILISQTTYEKLEGNYQFGDSRALSVKGIEEELKVYAVLGEHQ
ncbi:adenylate/guanylate cyclase domain-containing protein [Luminiphilus sp. nBUS_07]|uniref:adenylate/guanylate cyclase domain-containing protein n=1 Tax=Luminiphilus sp. nBUS_07 TaxID=3395314 RepID=UPI003EC0D25E